MPAQPEVVASYLREAANTLGADGQHAYAAATLSRWATAIGQRHRSANLAPPTATEFVRATLSHIRAHYAINGARPIRRTAPLLTADIVSMIAAARRDTTNWASEVYERRDSALLLIGYAGAMRRRELVELACGDITADTVDGIGLYARRRHQRPTGAGHPRTLPYGQAPESCPPCAAARWIHVVAAFDTGGRSSVIRLLKSGAPFDTHICGQPLPRTQARAPVFRSVSKNGNLSAAPLSGAAIHRVIRRRAQLAGYDDQIVAQLGVQSLRAGFITQTLRNGADRRAIAQQTGHTDPATLEAYAERDLPHCDNAATGLGL